MNDLSALSRAFDIQAGACVAFGSPFSGALLARAKQDIDAGGVTAELLAYWAGATTRTFVNEAVAIRWLGAAHDLALSGEIPALSAAYPSPGAPGDPGAAWKVLADAMIAEPDRFVDFMSHEPQTNEVRRSACLLPGFVALAEATGLALRLFEIGASAGLNQLWDRYAYDFGPGRTWGDPASPVRLEAEWRGPWSALDSPVTVISRAACDRKPVDIRDPVARRRLKAYVWADQFDRLAWLEAAIATALANDTRVDAEDAVTWTESRAGPAVGAVTVLFHSIFWQYMPDASKGSLTRVIGGLGAKATLDAPFAWLRMEPPPENLAIVELRLTLWPGGEDRLLAHVHPHGAWVAWGKAP